MPVLFCNLFPSLVILEGYFLGHFGVLLQGYLVAELPVDALLVTASPFAIQLDTFFKRQHNCVSEIILRSLVLAFFIYIKDVDSIIKHNIKSNQLTITTWCH